MTIIVEMKIRVLTEDTLEPVAGLEVDAAPVGELGGGCRANTDANGVIDCTDHPPGRHEIYLCPDEDSGYRWTPYTRDEELFENSRSDNRVVTYLLKRAFS
ncbi:MAG: hypothetical protein HKN23_12055 [Verrucomicrobiales bacterium]|nr:hypothetical protein [Verrucomicrobiales bacterium]